MAIFNSYVSLPEGTQHPVVQFPIRIQVPPSQSLPACVGPISRFVQNSSSEICQVSGIRLQSGSLSQERGGGKDSAPEQPL